MLKAPWMKRGPAFWAATATGSLLLANAATAMVKGLSLKGKVVLVTGASSGIGAQVVEKLANAGARVILVARTASKLESKAAELNAKFGEGTALAVPCDCSDMEAVNKASAHIEAAFGSVPDVLINCAGAGRWRYLDEMDESELRSCMDGATALCPVSACASHPLICMSVYGPQPLTSRPRFGAEHLYAKW